MPRWLFLLVLLAGCSRPPADLPAADARTIADKFLADVRAGKADAAWADTGTDFKSYLGKEAFRALVKATPALRGPAEFADAKMTEVNGLRLAECTYTAKAGRITVDLAADPAGVWRVEKVAVAKP